MSRPINPRMISGTISGSCPKCRMSYTGEFKPGVIEDSSRVAVELNCNGCGHSGKYFFYWPDELPEVNLRHVGNRHLLGYAERRRKYLSNPDGVLPGQMSFKIPKSKRGT